MKAGRYTEADVRNWVDRFPSPLLALQQGKVLCANATLLELLGYQNDDLYGQSGDLVVALEERRRIRELWVQALADPDITGRLAFPLHLRSRAGALLRVEARLAQLPAAKGGTFELVTFFAQPRTEARSGLAELLVEISAQLLAERTEAGVQEAVLKSLGRAGWFGAFCAAGREGVSAPTLAPPFVFLPAYAQEALTDGRPVFAGASGEPTHVYLGIQPGAAGRPEVLVVAGSSLGVDQSFMLALFAKQVTAALANARFIAEGEQRNAELRAVASVARLAAQAIPEPLESFLLRAAKPLAAREVVLELDDPRWGAQKVKVPFSQGEQSDLGATAWHRLTLPLLRNGRQVGALSALRIGTRPFESTSLDLLQTFADLLATALERRSLQEDAAHQLEETRLLLELARTAAGTLELSSILNVACDFLIRLLDVTHAFVLLLEKDGLTLRGAAASEDARGMLPELLVSRDSTNIVGQVARERRVVAVSDVDAEPSALEGMERLRPRALLGVPLLIRDELVAVVVVSEARRPRTFPPALLELFQAVVGQLALSVENARLYTSLKQSYAELAETRAEMVRRERLAALGELSAVVAHEVRNPLGALVNALSALRPRVAQGSEAQLLVSLMSEEADRLNRIVGDLLDFARPRKAELEPEDIHRLIEESVDAARASLRPESPPVEFSLELAQGLPRAQVDRRLFRQVMLNVALNAADAMPQGGKVRVRAAQEEREGRLFLRVDVMDSGVGMPKERISRIFEPFFTTKAQGTGLGLAVVKRIVDEHMGELEVDSEPGRGTRFTFRFPLLGEEARA